MKIKKRQGYPSRTRKLCRESLEPRWVLSVMISEVLAKNDFGIVDGHGNRSDWIELFNPTPNAQELTGWTLENDGDIWTFPSATIEPFDYLLVFASGDEAPEPEELHASFRLDPDGEDVILRDATDAVIHEFSFPEMSADISYGHPFELGQLVGPMSTFRYTTVDPLGDAWRQIAYQDEHWSEAEPGFGTSFPGFTVRMVDVGSNGIVVGSLDEAERILAGNIDLRTHVLETDLTRISPQINFGGGDIPGDFPLPDGGPVSDDSRDQFILHVNAEVVIPGGDWTIGFNSAGPGYLRVLDVEFREDLGFDSDVIGGDTISRTANGVEEWTFGQISTTSTTTTTLEMVYFSSESFTPGQSFGTQLDSVEIALLDSHGVPNANTPLLGDGQFEWQVRAGEHPALATAIPEESELFGRVKFDVADPNAVESLSLLAQYTDDFDAHLNGISISPATSNDRSASEASRFKEFEVDLDNSPLVAGTNVLTFESGGLLDDSFFLNPMLYATGQFLHEQGQYFALQTPGRSNIDLRVGDLLSNSIDLVFSQESGFIENPIDVTLTPSNPDMEIFYTIDGSIPNRNSLPYQHSPSQDVIVVDETQIVRAIGYSGTSHTRVVTKSYINFDDVAMQAPGNQPGGFDENLVEEINATIQADLQSLPTLSLAVDPLEFFGDFGIYDQLTGEEIRVSAELIGADGVLAFQADAGVQIHGFQSQTDPKKSLRLEFKQRYGPRELAYEWFGPDAATSFDVLVLRAGGRDVLGQNNTVAPTYAKERLVGDTQNSMGGNFTHHGDYVHLYINGFYWGLYSPTERPDASFASDYFGGADDEYEVIKGVGHDWVVRDGKNEEAEFNSLLTATRDLPTNPAGYASVKEMLDVTAFTDYVLLNLYGYPTDWGNNWYATLRTEPVGRWYFHSWDVDFAWSDLTQPPLPPSNGAFPVLEILSNLLHVPEYRRVFADRIQRNFFGDGLLGSSQGTQILDSNRARIEAAIRPDVARWGDSQTLDNEWEPHFDALRDLFLDDDAERRDNVLTAWITNEDWTQDGLFPSVAAPTMLGPDGMGEQHGGAVNIDDSIQLLALNGEAIYYTTDGTDPRGADDVAVGQAYTGPIRIEDTKHIRARTLNADHVWSALAEATFTVHEPASAANIAITEIMYHPDDPSESESEAGFSESDFEFIEVMNAGQETIDLVGLQFTQGIRFDFTAESLLDPLNPQTGDNPLTLKEGEAIVVVADRTAMQERYGTALSSNGVRFAGEFSFYHSLSNGGERIRLIDADGDEIQDFVYDDSDDWPDDADGDGESLEIISTEGDYETGSHWRASSRVHGTPGWQEGVAIRINEVLTRPQGNGLDFVELFNTYPIPIEVSGWFLTDDLGNKDKFSIPPMSVIVGNSFLSWDENFIFPIPDDQEDVRLWLYENSNGVPGDLVDTVSFGAALVDESFGHLTSSTGEDLFIPLVSSTRDQANAVPRIGPIIISEIMYNPPDSNAPERHLEFIELTNVSDTTVDLTGWSIEGRMFDDVTSLPAGASLLVVGFDEGDGEEDLESFYDRQSLLYEYTDIGLKNGGETLTLRRPHQGMMGGASVVVDEVHYDDESPWPDDPDGDGESLHRCTLGTGLDPANWCSNHPTPGILQDFQVHEISVNDDISNPPDLALGPQPYSWRQQRSSVRQLDIDLGWPIDPQSVDANSFLLVNVGVNAPLDTDFAMVLDSSQIEVLDTVIRLNFEAGELPDGYYSLQIADTVKSINGVFLDGDGDGVRSPFDQADVFYVLAADFNGDGGTTIFDFKVISYWFGTSAPAAPEYVDLNGDGAVSIFDFPMFRLSFGQSVTGEQLGRPQSLDDALALDVAAIYPIEPNAFEGGGPAKIAVVRNLALEEKVVYLDFSLPNDANEYHDGNEGTIASGITFPVGEIIQVVDIYALGDSVDEANETLQISLSTESEIPIYSQLSSVDILLVNNVPPHAADDEATTLTDEAITIDVLSNDLDAEQHALSITSAMAASGAVEINSGETLTYTPTNGFSGTESITYSISDGYGGTDTATVTVSVVDLSYYIQGNALYIIGGESADEINVAVADQHIRLSGEIDIETGLTLNDISSLWVYGREGNDSVTIDSSVTGPNLTQIYLYGESGDDSLTTNSVPTVADGGEGEDTVVGGDGNDTLYGGHGADSVLGGDGDDVVYFGNDDFQIMGGAGDDWARTEPDEIGVTFYFGSSSEVEYIEGSSGGDYLDASTIAAPIAIWGHDGDDNLFGGSESDILYGGNGGDNLYGGAGDDEIHGGAGEDYISGDAGLDSLHGGGAVDQLFGGSGDDHMNGNEGDDSLFGDEGNDYIDGGLGDDSMLGGQGDDTLYGRDGDDRLEGDEDNDTLHGNEGADSLNGGSADDTLYGGDGNDYIVGGDGFDEIHGQYGDDLLFGDAGDDVLYGDEGNDQLDGGDDADNIQGGPGTDTLNGGYGDDSLYGGDDDDFIDGDDGNDWLFGNDGNDRTDGGYGDDVIEGGSGDDLLFGRDGYDSLEGNDGNNVLSGDDGDDTLTINGSGQNILIGGYGSDYLYGGFGNDILLSDVYYADDATLLVVLNQWIGASSFAGGVADLRGSYLESSNVYGDCEFDTIDGNSGDNWGLLESSDGWSILTDWDEFSC